MERDKLNDRAIRFGVRLFGVLCILSINALIDELWSFPRMVQCVNLLGSIVALYLWSNFMWMEIRVCEREKRSRMVWAGIVVWAFFATTTLGTAFRLLELVQ